MTPLPTHPGIKYVARALAAIRLSIKYNYATYSKQILGSWRKPGMFGHGTAAAGHPHRETAPVMVPAEVAGIEPALTVTSAPKFAAPDHKGVIQ